MDLPLALAALLLLLVLLAAPPAALLIALHLNRLRRPRLSPPEPAAAALEPSAPAEEDEGGEEKRRRRRARRKQQQKQGGDGAPSQAAGGGGRDEALPPRPRFPLASVAGALQRRITARYDELARASQAQSLTIDHVREFLNTLVDARDELVQKSENTRRSITIRKAMLSNSRNGRSSHDHLRLCEQVDRLEFEYERLKKDASIYHNLHEQLQLSSCYKLMEESNDEAERKIREAAFATGVRDTTFEDLLAVEKKDDAFWRRHGKLRSISDSM